LIAPNRFKMLYAADNHITTTEIAIF